MYEQFQVEYRFKPEAENKINYLMEKNPDSNRKLVFLSTLKNIIAHNKDTTKTYKQGVNTFADFTEDEFFDFFNLRDG